MYLHLHSHIKLRWNVFLLKNNKVKPSGYCGKIAEWVEWDKLPVKEWRLSIKDVVKKVVKKFF